jgi:hypothetical protein
MYFFSGANGFFDHRISLLLTFVILPLPSLNDESIFGRRFSMLRWLCMQQHGPCKLARSWCFVADFLRGTLSTFMCTFSVAIPCSSRAFRDFMSPKLSNAAT